MKKCNRCGEEKPLDLFSIRKTAKDGKQSYCKQCAVDARMIKYYKNYAEERQYRKNYSKENSKKLKEYKESLPCTDCGVYYPSYVTDFDHISDNKSANIGNMMSRGWPRILKEIEKCELVCANCHRERTHQRAVS